MNYITTTEQLRMEKFSSNDRRKPTANKGLAIAGGQWLIEVLCFYFTFALADSFVLRNARHRQAPER